MLFRSKFAFKGCETKTFMYFIRGGLAQNAHRVPNSAHMLAAGAAFIRRIQVCKGAGHKFTDAEQKDQPMNRPSQSKSFANKHKS